MAPGVVVAVVVDEELLVVDVEVEVVVVVVVVGPAHSNCMATQQAWVSAKVHVLIFAGLIIQGSGLASH